MSNYSQAFRRAVNFNIPAHDWYQLDLARFDQRRHQTHPIRADGMIEGFV